MKPLPTPLVEPGPALTAQESARYARHLSLSEIGVTGQRRLKAARVLVIGAGGLGSPVLHYLAAAGVGTLGIVDDDVVEISNLQRQVVHSVDRVGEPKVDSAADAVARINPLVRVERHTMRLGASDAVDLVGGYDLVIDGADNFATRYLVSDACTLTSTPCVWGSVLRFEGRVSVFWSGPSHDGITYRDLHPDPPPPGSVPSCAAGGVIGALPGTLGSLMAAEAVKVLTGCGDPLYGRVLLHDALAMSFRELRIVPDPEAPLVTSVQDMTQACSLGSGPAVAATVTVDELDARLRSGAVLVDVREDWERDIVAIPGARAVPLVALQEAGVSALPDGVGGRDVIFHCRSGARSALAVEAVASSFAGREESVAHLDGGVLEWVRVLHPEMPTY